VNEVGSSGLHKGNELECLIKVEVGAVGFVAKGIYHEGIDVADFFHGGLGNGACISNVGEIFYPISED